MPDASTQTLVNVTGTRGRFYGYYVDVDGATALNQDIQITLDGEASPSINLNTGFVRDIWRQSVNGEGERGSGTFGLGEYASAQIQLTHFFTPGHMGYYSDFSDSMTVELINNGGAISVDWGLIWDEAV